LLQIATGVQSKRNSPGLGFIHQRAGLVQWLQAHRAVGDVRKGGAKMVFDLFTLSGVLLVVAMLASLIATHDFRHGASSGGSSRDPRAKSRPR
jgi:hypothetical protein